MSEFLLQTELVARLLEVAELSNFIGERFYPSEATNQSSQEIYVVYDQISYSDQRTHDGECLTPVSVFEFKIYSPAAGGRLQASDALHKALVSLEKSERNGLYFSAVEREYTYDGKESVTLETGGKRVMFRRLANYRISWQDKNPVS